MKVLVITITNLSYQKLKGYALYPSIACVNKMYPAHLGEDFFKVYKNNIVDVRLAEKLKPKNERNIAIIEGFKEAANASYGRKKLLNNVCIN